MPNFTFPIGPLQLILNGRSWGLFSITADGNGQTQFALVPTDSSINVGTTVVLPLTNNTFAVTFSLNGGNFSATLQLTGSIQSNLLITGTCNFSEQSLGGSSGGALSENGVSWQAGLLPIQAQIQIADNPPGVLAIDQNLNLSYTPQSSTAIALGSVGGNLDARSGVLKLATLSPPLGLGGENYTYIRGAFTSSTAGSGNIGPCTASRQRQQGDDTWSPVLQG